MTIRKLQPSPSLKHPLMGAELKTLLNAFFQHGGVSLRCLPHAGLFLLSALLRAPFAALERLAMQQDSRTPNPIQAPMFIVGHWRSGTTHLHNLLSCSPAFGIISPLASGLPGELLTLATWLRPFLEKALPATRGVDPVAVTPNSPQEDEIPLANLQLLSVFHALYFPKKFSERFHRGVFFDGASAAKIARWERELCLFLRKVSRQQRKSRILIKNPVYTARVRRLLSIWPEAKFLHIYRNPYDVFASSIHYFSEMLFRLSLQRVNNLDVAAFVLRAYPRMLDALYDETSALPPTQYCETRYETLEQNPLEELERIHNLLALPDWRKTRPKVASYLASLPPYQKNQYLLSPKQLRQIKTSWNRYIQKWGYSPPAK